MKKCNVDNFFSSNEFYAGVCIDNKLYCVEYYYNTILSIDLISSKLDCVGGLKDEIFSSLLFTDVKCWKDKIIFIPYYAEHIHVYDVKNNVDDVVKCEEECDLRCDKHSIAFWNEGRYYLLPFMGEYILEMDLNNQIVTRKMNVGLNLRMLGITYDYFSVCDVYKYNNTFFVAMYDHPYIVGIDLKKNKVDVLKVSEVQNGFMSIVGVEDKLYILSREKTIVVFNLNEKKIEKICNLDVESDIFLSRGLSFDKHIYFWETAKTTFIDYDIGRNEAIYSDFNLGWNLNVEDGERFKFLCCTEEKKVVLISDSLKVSIYDLTKRKNIIKLLEYDKEYVMQKIARYFYGSRNQMSHEHMNWDFTLWLKYCESEPKREQDREIGMQIWRKLKDKGEY